MSESKTLTGERDEMEKILADEYAASCGGQVATDAADHGAAIASGNYQVPLHLRGHGATVVDKKPRP